MTVVRSVASAPGGTPLTSLRVTVTLVTGAGALPGYTSAGDIVGPGYVLTDENGAWSLDLVPNSQITPANTYYRVAEAGAVTTIVVPASGGPYQLIDVLSTSPPTPGVPGITGVQLAVDGTVKGLRPAINLVAGTNVTITGTDNADANRVDVTVDATGGGGGAGTVTSVNGVDPDSAGNVQLNAGNLGADTAGAATAAQAAAITAAEANAAGLYVPLSSKGAPGGVATLDGSGHLTAAQASIPSVFSPLTYGAKVDGRMVVDGAMTTGSAVLACTISTPFVAGDAGVTPKHFMVKGAGTFGVTTLITTASSFTDAGHIVLADVSSATITNAVVIWGTDDTAAYQAAIYAGTTYARANTGLAKVLVPAGISCIAGPLSHADLGNAQLTTPVIPVTENTVTLAFEGVGTGNAIRHWDQTVPQLAGSCLVSFGVYESTDAQVADINANGQPALIGGPTGPNGFGTDTFLFSNMNVVLKSLSLVTTYSSFGLGYGGAWLWGVDQANIEDVGINTTAVFNNGSGELGSVGALASGASIGLGLPATSNQNNVSLNRVTIGGGFTYGLLATEHMVAVGCHIFYCWAGLCPVGSFHDGDGSTANTSSHAIDFGQIGIEGCAHSFLVMGSGASGIGPFVKGGVDSEGGVAWLDDGHGGLAAAIGEIRLTGTTGGALTLSTGTRLTIIDERSPNGPGAPWALTVGTPFMNPQWRPADVLLSGGTGLTGIQLGALRGGPSAPTMSSYYTQAAGPLPPIHVRVPPGGWLEVTGTGSPTAPTATVAYD